MEYIEGAFNDIDRTFLSEHAAVGLENRQIRVKFYLTQDMNMFKILQRQVPPVRYPASVNNQQEDLVRQNLSYQQELVTLRARVNLRRKEKRETRKKKNERF